MNRLYEIKQPKNGTGQRIRTSVFILDDGVSAEIVTKLGRSIFISASDVDLVVGINWHVSAQGYAVRNRPSVYLHRVISGANKGQMVDHIDSDRLNNRRENLRLCTASGNAQNKSMHRTNASGFKGVYFQKESGNYIARICADRKTVHLGSFKTAQEAHEVYCQAADKLHGEFANHGGRNVDVL